MIFIEILHESIQFHGKMQDSRIFSGILKGPENAMLSFPQQTHKLQLPFAHQTHKLQPQRIATPTHVFYLCHLLCKCKCSPLLHSYTGLKYNLQLAGWHEGLTLHMQLCQIQQHNQEMKPLV